MVVLVVPYCLIGKEGKGEGCSLLGRKTRIPCREKKLICPEKKEKLTERVIDLGLVAYQPDRS